MIDEARLEELWLPNERDRKSMRGAVQLIMDGLGDIQSAHIEPLDNRLAVVPGDIQLTAFEQKLSDAWPRCMDRYPAAFPTASSFYRIIERAGQDHEADIWWTFGGGAANVLLTLVVESELDSKVTARNRSIVVRDKPASGLRSALGRPVPTGVIGEHRQYFRVGPHLARSPNFGLL